MRPGLSAVCGFKCAASCAIFSKRPCFSGPVPQGGHHVARTAVVDDKVDCACDGPARFRPVEDAFPAFAFVFAFEDATLCTLFIFAIKWPQSGHVYGPVVGQDDPPNVMAVRQPSMGPMGTPVSADHHANTCIA